MYQVLGVYDKKWVRPLAEVLQKLGSKHVLVVHSADGLDEFSIADKSYVAELKNNEIVEYEITPEELGLSRAPLSDIVVDSAAASLALIKQAYRDVECSAAKMLCLNAGAAIYAANITPSFKEGVTLAQTLLRDGQAKAKFEAFIEYTQAVRSEDFEP